MIILSYCLSILTILSTYRCGTFKMLKKILSLLLFASLAVVSSTISNGDISRRSDPSPGPFATSSRWILDANGNRFKFRCVHWVGHMETNIPEGLQHQSVDYISAWIAKSGFNCIRLSYSIDMALNQGLSVKDSFTAAAASTQTAAVAGLYNDVKANNDWITDTTTVIEVFEKVIASLGAYYVKVILDNHVSKASWCCSQSDGNGWFDTPGSSPSSDTTYFDIGNWLTGLTAMAAFAKGKPNVIGMDLRNELRPTDHDTDNWYKYIPEGASAIYKTNPSLLIIIGGLSYAIDLSFVYQTPLDLSQWPNRVVWEFHNYVNSYSDVDLSVGSNIDCPRLQSDIGSSSGYLLTQGKAYTAPLWLSEFGFDLKSTAPSDQSWITCIVAYMTSNDAEWSWWTLGGSYYVLFGNVNATERYGALDPQWRDWQNADFQKTLGWPGGMWAVKQGPS